MSIVYCEKHDLHFDSDMHDCCEECANIPLEEDDEDIDSRINQAREERDI